MNPLTANNFIGFLLAICVLVLLLKILGPKWQVPTKKKRKTRTRTVRVDPLVAKERKLASELRYVRTQIRQRDTSFD